MRQVNLFWARCCWISLVVFSLTGCTEVDLTNVTFSCLGDDDCKDGTYCLKENEEDEKGQCVPNEFSTDVTDPNPDVDSDVIDPPDGEETGCYVDDDGTLMNCDDGNECTNDYCEGSTCVNEILVDVSCDDGDPCTVNECDDKGACVTIGPACIDDDACTEDICNTNGDPMQCQFDPIECDDGESCTDDSCASESGCVFTPADSPDQPCDDGEPCYIDDRCVDGSCVSGDVLLDCNDNDACTIDFCFPGDGGCSYAQVGCDDLDECTLDSCNMETGCVFDPQDCGDENPCTEDSCVDGDCSNPFSEPTTSCDDGDLCSGDWCDGEGTCQPFFDDCDDGDACTVESCFSDSGCQAIANTNCNDNDACTIDSCDPQEGCVHEADSSCCGDGQIQGVEGCDDANEVVGDGCSPGCVLECSSLQLVGGVNGDYIQFEDSEATDLGLGDFTIEAWVYPQSTHGLVLSKRDVLSYYQIWYTTHPGETYPTFQLEIYNSGALLTYYTSTAVPLEEWVHVAFVRKGSEIRIYLNGQSDVVKSGGNSIGSSDPSTYNLTNSKPFTVGCTLAPPGFSPASYLSMMISSLRITKEALYQDASIDVPFSLGPDNASLALAFSDGAFTETIQDSSPSGEIGSLVGGDWTTQAPGCSGCSWDGIDFCDDGDICTNEYCHGAGGCDYTSNDCDDGASCSADSCETGEGCQNEYIEGSCGDGNDCTADLCDGFAVPDGSFGCYWENLEGDCDDDDACTEFDSCTAGQCYGTNKPCSDGNGCTLDFCNEEGACENLDAAFGSPCDDGDFCGGDSCDGSGGCLAGVGECDDADPCTYDSCNPATGCSFVSGPFQPECAGFPLPIVIQAQSSHYPGQGDASVWPSPVFQYDQPLNMGFEDAKITTTMAIINSTDGVVVEEQEITHELDADGDKLTLILTSEFVSADGLLYPGAIYDLSIKVEFFPEDTEGPSMTHFVPFFTFDYNSEFLQDDPNEGGIAWGLSGMDYHPGSSMVLVVGTNGANDLAVRGVPIGVDGQATGSFQAALELDIGLGPGEMVGMDIYGDDLFLSHPIGSSWDDEIWTSAPDPGVISYLLDALSPSNPVTSPVLYLGSQPVIDWNGVWSTVLLGGTVGGNFQVGTTFVFGFEETNQLFKNPSYISFSDTSGMSSGTFGTYCCTDTLPDKGLTVAADPSGYGAFVYALFGDRLEKRDTAGNLIGWVILPSPVAYARDLEVDSQGRVYVALQGNTWDQSGLIVYDVDTLTILAERRGLPMGRIAVYEVDENTSWVYYGYYASSAIIGAVEVTF